MLTLDDVLNGRWVAGRKMIDVAAVGRLVLEGGSCALRHGRIDTLQVRWNEASLDVLGQDRRPVEELVCPYGYELYRPVEEGVLAPLAVAEFGEETVAHLVPRCHPR